MTTIDPALVESAAAAILRARGRSFTGRYTEYLAHAALSAVLPDALAEKDAEIQRLLGRLDRRGHSLRRSELARSRLARVLASVEALADEWDAEQNDPWYWSDVTDRLRALLADAQATTEGSQS